MTFNFEVAERITKQMLLERYSEEQYMSFYLGIIPDKSLHCNPLRSDRRPTAGFFRSRTNDLIFKDFSTGWYGDFVGVVEEKFHVNYPKALKIIANDFSIVEKSAIPKNSAAIAYDGSKVTETAGSLIQCEVQPFTTSQLKWWKSFGISEETLKLYNVHSIKSVFLNGSYLMSTSDRIPGYGYYFGKEEGRELWKVYYPTKTQYRFLGNTSKLQGAKQLPSKGKVVVVTKSMKDVMCLYELGIPAVAPQAESVIITTQQYQALSKRFEYVIINGDWDPAGQHFMSESRRRYYCLALSFTDKLNYAKDISDYVKKHGKEKAEEVIKLVQQNLDDGLYDYHLDYCKSNHNEVSLPL